MKIYLIRHGRQCDKRCNVDVDLSEEGFLQADLAGRRMKNWGIQKVYSSDMVRARQTAETANKHWNVDHEVIPEFRELYFGEMEGMMPDQIPVVYAEFQKEQDAMVKDLKYPGGESPGEVAERGMKALEKVVASGLDCVAVATHGVWIRAVLCRILGLDVAKWKLFGVTFENGSITELGYVHKKGFFTVERFNDYAHLENYPELLREAWGVKES